MGETANGRDSVVGRKSRRGQRQPPCWLNRAGFEPFGVRRAVQVGALSGLSEPWEGWYVHGAAQIRSESAWSEWSVKSAPRPAAATLWRGPVLHRVTS